MKKTLLLLLTFICVNTAFAQQHLDLDHPTGNKLSSSEKHSIQTLLMELYANPAHNSPAELKSYSKDIQNHLGNDVTTSDMLKMQHDLQLMSQMSDMLSRITSMHASRVGEFTGKFDDKVTLEFKSRNGEPMSLMLGMDPRSGEYVISSVHKGH
jgi:hypothetical protein